MIVRFKQFIYYLKFRFLAVAFMSEMLAVRFSLSVAAIIFGGFLIFQTSNILYPEFSLMMNYAPLVIWGWAFLCQGIFSFINIFYPSNLDKFEFIFDSMLGCILWSLSSLSILVGAGNIPSSLAGNLSLTLASWWNMVRFNRTLEL